MVKGPVLIALEEAAVPAVTEAPVISDMGAEVGQGAAMAQAATFVARPVSRLARWFWALALALFMMVLGTLVWDFATLWITRQPLIGWSISGLSGALLCIIGLVALRELAALRRLARVDEIKAVSYTHLTLPTIA